MAPKRGQHRCETCNLDFDTAFSLKRHCQKKHVAADVNEAEEPQCKICSKKFSNTCNLKRHVIQIHETVRVQPIRDNRKRKYRKSNLILGRKQFTLARRKARSLIAGRSVKSSNAETSTTEALLLMVQTAPADKETLDCENHSSSSDEELKKADSSDVNETETDFGSEEEPRQEQAEILEVGDFSFMRTSTPCSENPVEQNHSGNTSLHMNLDENLQPLSSLNETNCSCD